ncbi:hypothetical protein HY604_01825 [Candidatus Peregrinibacteria bacterium]|nr:hypothetical protein [Candidatus Peregrinibacteria bacterium]
MAGHKIETNPEDAKISKKAQYSANFIKQTGAEKIEKYAKNLGVKTALDLKDEKKLVDFVEEFQAKIRAKEGISANFNMRLLSDGYFGPHTLNAAKYAQRTSEGQEYRRDLQDSMHSRHVPGGPPQSTTPQIPPPKRPSAPKEKPRKADAPAPEKLPKDLDSYMNQLREMGFKAEIVTNQSTGYRICVITPKDCDKCKVFLPGDGGRIENTLMPKGSLIKTMDRYWKNGGKMGLVFIEGRRKNDKIKKYAQLDVPGNFKSIIDQAQGIAGTQFKTIEISGYSQGGFGIKGILTAGDLNDRITRIFANDAVWNPKIAQALKDFASQKGKIVEVAIGKSSAYSHAYFRDKTPIYVHNSRSVGHGAMLGKHMEQALSAG